MAQFENNPIETQKFLRGFNTILLSIITLSLGWFAKSIIETKENVSIIYNDIQYLKKDVQHLQAKIDASYTRDQIDTKLDFINDKITEIQNDIKEIKRK
jgi:peptidoglycan hydrolase CwlO-like protein